MADMKQARVVIILLLLVIACVIAFMAQPRLSSLTHLGPACNVTASANATTPEDADDAPPHTYAAGVSLSIAADVIIAIGLTIEKRAHMTAQAAGKADGVGTPWFFVGIILKNVVGELGNLLAYGLAPASVVAPVGTVAVAVNAILAVKFLGEPCRARDWIALVLVAAGIVLIVVAVPEADERLSVHHLLSDHFYYAPRAYLFLLSLIPLIGFFILFVEPRWAKTHIVVWLFLCGLISSVTVAAARGFASLITQVIDDCSAESCVHGVLHPPCAQTIGHWLFWGLLGIIALTGVWSEYYRVLATEHFENTKVLPVYQCFFTICSVLGGMLIYNEFEHVTLMQAALFAAGCALSMAGILLLLWTKGGERPPDGPSASPHARMKMPSPTARAAAPGAAAAACDELAIVVSSDNASSPRSAGIALSALGSSTPGGCTSPASTVCVSPNLSEPVPSPASQPKHSGAAAASHTFSSSGDRRSHDREAAYTLRMRALHTEGKSNVSRLAYASAGLALSSRSGSRSKIGPSIIGRSHSSTREEEGTNLTEIVYSQDGEAAGEGAAAPGTAADQMSHLAAAMARRESGRSRSPPGGSRSFTGISPARGSKNGRGSRYQRYSADNLSLADQEDHMTVSQIAVDLIARDHPDLVRGQETPARANMHTQTHAAPATPEHAESGGGDAGRAAGAAAAGEEDASTAASPLLSS